MSSLGNLFFNIAVDHAEFTAGLTKSEAELKRFADRSKKNINDFEKSVKDTFSNIAKLAAGFVTFDALQSSLASNIAKFDEITKMAKKTGSSFEELTRQQRALARAGEDFATGYGAALNKLSINLGSLNKNTSIALNALGVSSKDASGKLRDTAAVARDVAIALQGYENGAGKAAAVNALFGKSGVDLIPVLDDLASEYQNVTGLSSEFEQQILSINDQLDLASAQFVEFGQNLTVALLPALVNVGEAFAATGINASSFGKVIGEGLATIIRGVSSTFTLFVSIIHGTGAALGELFSGNFSKIGSTFSEVKGSYDKTIESLFKGTPAIQGVTVATEGQKKSLDGLVKSLGSADGATKKLSKTQKEQISDADKFMQSLNRELETLNKTSSETKKLEAAKLGLSKVADPLIDRIEKENAEFKKQQDLLTRGKSLTESVRNEQEIYSDTQKELNELLKSGNISQETYNRALSQAGEELKKTEKVAQSVFPNIEEFAVQASRNIQNAFSNAIRLGIEGDFKGMVTSFKSALLQMIAEAASIDLARAIFGGGTGGQSGGSALGSLFSGFGSGGKGGSTGGLSLGSLFSSKGLASIFGIGAGFSGSAANAFTGQTFLGGSGTALGGSGLTSGASLGGLLNTLGAGVIGAGIGSTLGGNKSLFGLSAGTTSTIGATLGAFGGPIGSAIGGIIGGGLNALFGRGPLKQKETNLIGSFGADGFTGTTSTKFKAQGGLLVGDKVVRLVADTATGEALTHADGKLKDAARSAGELAREVGKFIEGQWLPITSSFGQIADQMGLASSAIEGFNFQINIASEKGKALTQEQIGEKIAEAADNLARNLVPGIDALKKGSESAAEALSRLSIQFDDLLTLAVARGSAIAGATALLKNTSAADQDAFFKGLGIDGLGTKANQFISNFGDTGFKQGILEDQVKTILSKFPGAKLSDIDTRGELLNIFKTVDLSTQQGKDALKAILDNQDLLLRYIESQEALANSATGGYAEVITGSGSLKSARKEAAKLAEESAKQLAEDINLAMQKAGDSFQNALLNGRFDEQLGLASQPLSENLTKLLNRSFAPGEFNAGNFNYQYSIAVAEAGKRAADFASENALKIANVGPLLGQLNRLFRGDELIKGLTKERVEQGFDRDTALFLANQYSRKQFQSRAPGIASVIAAEDDVKAIAANGYLNGKDQFGSDVLAYGNAINLLNKQLKNNVITVDSFNDGMRLLNREFGSDPGKLLNNTEAQLDRIQAANRRLGSAGLSSIQFYFDQITKSVKEFGAGLSEPAQAINQSVGRLNSLQFVMAKSAGAAISGFKKAGELGRLNEITGVGGSASLAQLIGKAAGIAGGVINTQQGQLIKAKLDQDALFNNVKDKKGLALLIEGVKQFDSNSFENAFNNLNAALIGKRVNEAQFTSLFNTALDAFEGLSGAVGASAEALSDLRNAAKALADDLLADPTKNVGSQYQAFNVAESQFNDLVKRAKSGDVTAANQLGGAAQNLLTAGQNSLADQTSLIGYVQANLRSIGSTGASARLTVDPAIQAQLDAQQKRLDQQSKTNTAILAALEDMRSTYRKWDTTGLLTTA